VILQATKKGVLIMQYTENTFSWSRYYAFRKEIRRAFPSVYRLKIKKKILDILAEEIRPGDKILDVGASTQALGEKIRDKIASTTYKTMDIDREQHHDYYSLDDITEQFDVIILSEVIEHLDLSEGFIMLNQLWSLLKKGGKIIVSTPNLHHPNRYWVSDHKTPYRHDEVGGALLSVGFKVDKIYRIYNDQLFKRLFRIYVMSYLHEYLDIDFAKSIIVVASKS
jgi:SAM-dependent methyltransferase